MKSFAGHVSAVLIFVFATQAQQSGIPLADRFPGEHWDTINPTAGGWDSARLDRARDYATQVGATTFMVIQHGLVVLSQGDTAERTELHSCRKSFLGALIGIAVAEKTIGLDDTLDELGIDDTAPALTAAEKQATVRDLLESRSGVYHPSAYETNGMADQRPERGIHPPGTYWYYNNWDFNTLGAIYEKRTHHRIFDALKQLIAKPIGMEDFRASDGRYLFETASRYPAYPIRMSSRDLARFAQLYLHNGEWNGKQIVPAEWVKASVHPWSDTESGGYGYLWWTADSATSGFSPVYHFPKGSFWLEGHLGQYAVVVPSQDLVIVFRVKGDHPEKEIHKRQAANLVRLTVQAEVQ